MSKEIEGELPAKNMGLGGPANFCGITNIHTNERRIFTLRNERLKKEVTSSEKEIKKDLSVEKE